MIISSTLWKIQSDHHLGLSYWLQCFLPTYSSCSSLLNSVSEICSIQKMTKCVQSRFSVDLVLFALIKKLPQVCSDTSFKLFRKTSKGYELYQPATPKVSWKLFWNLWRVLYYSPCKVKIFLKVTTTCNQNTSGEMFYLEISVNFNGVVQLTWRSYTAVISLCVIMSKRCLPL